MARSESVVTSGKSETRLRTAVRSLWRKMHSPAPIESNRGGLAKFSYAKCWAKSAGSRGFRGLSVRFAEIWWRREWDSNPRYGFPHTRFPSVRLKPLGHLSEEASHEGARGLLQVTPGVSWRYFNNILKSLDNLSHWPPNFIS